MKKPRRYTSINNTNMDSTKSSGSNYDNSPEELVHTARLDLGDCDLSILFFAKLRPSATNHSHTLKNIRILPVDTAECSDYSEITKQDARDYIEDHIDAALSRRTRKDQIITTALLILSELEECTPSRCRRLKGDEPATDTKARESSSGRYKRESFYSRHVGML